MDDLEKIQEKLEIITRKWWFLVLFILLGTITPPLVTKGFNPSMTGEIISYLLGHSLFAHGVLYTFYPVFKIVPIVLVLALIIWGNKVSRLFSVYVGFNYLLFAFLQGIAVTDEYGLGIVLSNFIPMILVAISWFWEAYVVKNDFTPQRISIIKYWVVPLAFIAFWYPLNLVSMQPDFNFTYLFTNPAGLAFCTMTPVYLSILTLYYPRVNMVTLRITSLLGIIIGSWNMITNFLIKPVLCWNGILHIPLLLISIYAFILSYKNLG